MAKRNKVVFAQEIRGGYRRQVKQVTVGSITSMYLRLSKSELIQAEFKAKEMVDVLSEPGLITIRRAAK